MSRKDNLKKELEAIEAKEEAKRTKWHMYEDAGCSKCNDGQTYSGGGSDLAITYYGICDCATIKTKRFKKFLKDGKNMVVKDYEKKRKKFYDNNSHIKIGTNERDC